MVIWKKKRPFLRTAILSGRPFWRLWLYFYHILNYKFILLLDCGWRQWWNSSSFWNEERRNTGTFEFIYQFVIQIKMKLILYSRLNRLWNIKSNDNQSWYEMHLKFCLHKLRVLFEQLCFVRIGQLFVALKRMSHFCQNNSKKSR